MINPEKLRLIDVAVSQRNIRSFADLGGVWNVDGYYSAYALQKHPDMRGYLVDIGADTLSPTTKSLPNLTIIKDTFGSSVVLDKIKFVDMIIMFDILLHQVNPSWKEILELYSSKTNCFIIYNPQFDMPKTTRLIDLGKTQYFQNVPHHEAAYNYDKIFINETETDPAWRDSNNFWQWAITDSDLIETLENLNFKLWFKESGGAWPCNAVSRSFAFVKHKKNREAEASLFPCLSP